MHVSTLFVNSYIGRS